MVTVGYEAADMYTSVIGWPSALVHCKYRTSSNNPLVALEDDDEIKTAADDNSNQSHEFISNIKFSATISLINQTRTIATTVR